MISLGGTYIHKMSMTVKSKLSDLRFSENLILVNPSEFDKYNTRVMVLWLNKAYMGLVIQDLYNTF